MMFILGVFFGLVLSILIFAIEIFLPRGRIVERVGNSIQGKTQGKGSVIHPVPEVVKNIEEKIKQNELRGVDTPIDDIL